MGCCIALCSMVLFFFNDTATTEIYTLSLHDALPISFAKSAAFITWQDRDMNKAYYAKEHAQRSEEHTSELQSHSDLVCRLLLAKNKNGDQAKTWQHAEEESDVAGGAPAVHRLRRYGT